MNKSQAQRLTNQMRRSLVNFERDVVAFMDGEGWRVLGYRTFAQWWDKELGEVALGSALKVVVLRAMEDDRRRSFGERVTRADKERGEYSLVDMARLLGVRGKTDSSVKRQARDLIDRGSDSRMRNVTAGLDPADFARLKALATAEGLSMADVVRRAIRQYLATHRVTKVAA